MFDIQDELKRLPDRPGVYIMKDSGGRVIYVGKAASLKNRVRQYFQASADQNEKTKALVARTKEFEYIVTDTEQEALILECNLIKKHRPRYNILLKDDKSYPSIKVTMNEEYPRVMMTRRVEKDGARYFGPYTSAAAVRETLDLIRKLFPVRSCGKSLPAEAGKGKPCLYYHIYQCRGPCRGNVNKEEYRALMEEVCSFLEGKQEDVIRSLEKKMAEAVENLEFEKAAGLRDKINSIKLIAEKQKVVSHKMAEQDLMGVAREGTDACVQVFFVRSGKLMGSKHFTFKDAGQAEDKELLSSFLKQFYSLSSYVPREILLEAELEEAAALEDWLGCKRGSRVRIIVPLRGEKRKLLDMAKENARIALKNFREKALKEDSERTKAMEGLKEVLGLKDLPERIEAYDISNTGASEITASMVVFEDGLPCRSDYRRFRVKGQTVLNDYGSMQEVLYRSLKRRLSGEDGEGMSAEGAGEKFGRLPDLLLVDGGLGHVNAAKAVMEEMGVYIPVAGMVKDDRHRTRGLVLPGGEVDITGNMPVLRLVSAIQDEAHRFALEYNRKLRSKRYTLSVLDEISGIGPERKKALLKHFGSVQKIKEAEVDQLAAVKGISRPMAEKIYAFFREKRVD